MYPLCPQSLLSCRPSKEKKKKKIKFIDDHEGILQTWDAAMIKQKQKQMLSLLLDHRISFSNSLTSILSG